MPSTKRIVCLANSWMKGGRCIAGRELAGSGEVGSWVRLTNKRKNQGLSGHESRYGNGAYPEVLDIMLIPLIDPNPQSYQSENWLLDPSSNRSRINTYPWNSLHYLLDPVAPLWIDGHSSQQGNNDRIPLDMADSLSDSLRLIRIDILDITAVWTSGKSKPNRQGRFRHANTQYALKITDPIYKKLYIKEGRERQIRDCFVTISLGEPFKGYAYKLIAAIIEKE